MPRAPDKTQLKPARGNHDRNREYRRRGQGSAELAGRERSLYAASLTMSYGPKPEAILAGNAQRGRVSRTVRPLKSLENRP